MSQGTGSCQFFQDKFEKMVTLSSEATCYLGKIGNNRFISFKVPSHLRDFKTITLKNRLWKLFSCLLEHSIIIHILPKRCWFIKVWLHEHNIFKAIFLF